MKFLRNLSVFGKVFASIATTVVLIVIFQALYFPSRQIAELNHALDLKARSLGIVLGKQLAAALDFGDPQAAHEALNALTEDPDFVYATVSNDKGDIIAHAGKQPAKSVTLDRKWQKESSLSSQGDLLVLKHPITTKAGAKGVLDLVLSTRSIANQIRNVRLATLLVGVIIIIMALIVAFFVGRVIARRLETMVAVAEKVAHGDLSHPPLSDDSGDELGSMARSFNRMLISQRELVTRIVDTAESITMSSTEFIANAQEQEQGVREQSSTIEEVSSSMNALSEAARGIAQNADTMAQVAEEMSSNASASQSALHVARQTIDQIVSKNELIAERINALYEKSRAIISVVDIIDDISDRLDLLALNAALEGSRVGEAGKGFSLVAQEMRRLAENVSGSTKEIKGTIDEIHRFIQASLEVSQEGTSTTREGATEMDKMSQSLSKMFSLIETSTDSARSITISTQQQLTSTEQMVSAMGQVASVSNQGLTSAQSVTRAATDMTELASRLRDQVRLFRVNGTEEEASA